MAKKFLSNKILFRVTASIVVLFCGAMIVAALTYTGKKTSGPVSDLFNQVGETVSNVENEVVEQTRQNTRSDELKWFNEYRNSVHRMTHPDTLLWGAYDNKTEQSFNSVIALEDTLHTKLPIISIYSAWGSKSSEQFPVMKAKAIYDLGSIPFITWEPWLNDFNAKDFPGIPADPAQRDKDCLKAIANGDYDSYLDKWIQQAKRFGAPIMVRFGHEMNDPYRYPWGPQNNQPQDFVAAWKHVVDRFRNKGAKNVIWIWSPHPAYQNFTEYYPGDDYVDWVGIPTLNYGTVASWSQWWSFDEIFGNYYPVLAQFKKPIMLTEFASLAVGGNRPMWYKNALTGIQKKYPGVKSIVLFHSSEDNTTTYKSLNWQVINDKTTVQKIIEAMQAIK